MPPFVFGKIATRENFTDRIAESKQLEANFKNLVNTIIISPRRWGKSSLVERACMSLKNDKEYAIVKMDAFNCRTEEVFYKTFSKAVISAMNNAVEGMMESARKYLSRFLPTITMSDSEGKYEFSLKIDLKDKSFSPDDILDLPQLVAADKKKKLVICIDEFQTIKDYEDSVAFQRNLRSHWQKHQDVCYCLYGSKRNMMVDLFADEKNPFYKFGDILFLEKISKIHWVDFIVERFQSTGKNISMQMAGYIADLAENHPYYVQQLSQLVWFRCADECTWQDVDEAFGGLVGQLSLVFSMIVDELTPKQINFLFAVADGVTNYTSMEVLSKYKLGTSANVKNLKNALSSKEIIDILPNGISIQDPIFKYWLQNVYGKCV